MPAKKSSKEVILEIKDLSIELPKRGDRQYAVEDVNITLKRGEVFCVVGESGSGKICDDKRYHE